MLFSSEYLVLLLLLPVTVFILIPLFMFVGWMTYLSMRELFFSRKPRTEESTKVHIEDSLRPAEA